MTKFDNIEIENRLRILRAEKKISQKKLAEELGVSRFKIFTLENNKSNIVDLDLLFKLSIFFDTPIDEIFFTKNVS